MPVVSVGRMGGKQKLGAHVGRPSMPFSVDASVVVSPARTPFSVHTLVFPRDAIEGCRADDCL